MNMPYRLARLVAAPALVAGLAAACGPDESTITAPSEVAGARVRAASITITPGRDTVVVGGTAQLTATVRDQYGNVISASLQWEASYTNIASVSSSGLVTGRAPGLTSVWARDPRTGVQGGAMILVQSGTATPPPPDTTTTTPPPDTTTPPPDTTTPPPPPTTSASCATPGAGWIWCDDFDTDRLSRYFDYNAASGGFARTSGVGRNGSIGMRARFAAGQVEAGNLKVAFGRVPSTSFRPVDAGTTNYRNIYWRFWVRTQPGWQGGTGYKLSRATAFAGSNWQQAMIAHLWGGSQGTAGQNSVFVDPASGTDLAGNLRTTTYNDFANLRWLGSAQSATPIFDAAHVGQWYCVEANARLNDAGQANGTFTMWINGAKEAERTGMNWVGSYSAYGINAVMLENYWNTGSPVAQERYMDDFVVSTQRIGC